MNNMLNAHKEKLANSIIVFGTIGLIFYAAMVAGSFFVKHGMQILSLLKGIGL